jgi:hypothetical protein
VQAHRALDGHLPITESFVGEDLRLLRLFECKVGVADPAEIGLGEFAVFLAEVFAQRLEPLCGINELRLAATMFRLSIG